MRGVVTRLEVGLSGLSLSVAGGLQDELLNLTARQLAVTNVMTTAEFKVRASGLGAASAYDIAALLLSNMNCPPAGRHRRHADRRVQGASSAIAFT